MRCSTCPVTLAIGWSAPCAIPALSPGWRSSFEALLEARAKGQRDDRKRRAHLSVPARRRHGAVSARFGVSRKVRETRQRDFAYARAQRTDSASPRLSPDSLSCCGSGRHLRTALMRSYSLSGQPGTSSYRVSVKREAHGAAGAYIDDALQGWRHRARKRARAAVSRYGRATPPLFC